MIIQDQQKRGIYNSDNLETIGIKERDGKYGIAYLREIGDQIFYIAFYSTKERAQFELDRLVEAFARDAKVYVMPEE